MNNLIYNISLILTIIGGLNCGLIGLFGFDAVAFLFGPLSVLSRIVYILVGASAVVLIFSWFVPVTRLSDTK